MARVDVFVETDYPPPTKIVAVAICPKCGARHTHSAVSDEAAKVTEGTA